MKRNNKDIVVEIFNDYYGEEFVDLQGNCIYVRFPKVTVTNENDRSIDITELYAKIIVSSTGTLMGTFSLNRAEYTDIQWNNRYIHSHVPELNLDYINDFKQPCLGTGPIRDTCASLNTSYNEDLWKLFVFELDKYVHTESLVGVPYIKLENVKASSSLVNIPGKISSYYINMNLHSPLYGFIKWLVKQRVFRFNYTGRYDIADSPYAIIVKMSNAFIEWYNANRDRYDGNLREKMTDDGYLDIYKASNGRIYRHNGSYNIEWRRYIGTPLWEFKGNRICLNITETYTGEENMSYLLVPELVMYIVGKLTQIINYRYGRNNKTEEKVRFV